MVEKRVIKDYEGVLCILQTEVEHIDRRVGEMYARKRETMSYMNAVTGYINNEKALRRQYTLLITCLKISANKIQEEIDSIHRYRLDLSEEIKKIKAWIDKQKNAENKY